MHVCFLCNEYPPGPHGGVGSFTRTLARALVAQGHQVTALGLYADPRQSTEQDQGVRVVRVPSSPWRKTGIALNGLRLRRALRQIHRRLPIDVLEGPELGLALLPRGFPAAKVIRMHGGHHFFSVTLGRRPRWWRSRWERRSFARADHLCAVSHFVAETTRQLLQLGDSPIEILPNPIDLSQFRSLPEVPEDPHLILFVGTVCEKKGIRQLIQAMPRIVAAVPRAVLWVAGRDDRDPTTGQSFTAQLRQLIPQELSERVVFQGALEHHRIPQLIARAAVCVYPSHMEAHPIAWLEGLAMGKAIVASRTGPGPEVVQHDVSGLLCNPHEPASIAECVIQLLRDPARRRRLGEAARQDAVERFSLQVLAERNVTFYQHCLDKRPRTSPQANVSNESGDC